MLRYMRWVLSWFGARRNVRSNILSPEKFQLLLSRECARADRNAHGFSLVIYDVHQMVGGAAMVNELCSQVRFFDVVGWIDSRRLAVFLPETLHDGAQIFTARIRERLNLWATPAEPTIKCYTGAIAPALENQVA